MNPCNRAIFREIAGIGCESGLARGGVEKPNHDDSPGGDSARTQDGGLPTGRIVLAREATLRLGPLTIDPPLRRIAHDDGREEIVEQRVMQVLVALVKADGAILTRDDLIAACWEGRIVGDDAISRVMSRLRRLAADRALLPRRPDHHRRYLSGRAGGGRLIF